jgi:hypothetical protein
MIVPFVTNLFTMGASELLTEEEPEPSRKSRRKRSS